MRAEPVASVAGGSRLLAPIWGAAGVSLLFASAVARLGTRGIDTVQHGLAGFEWVALITLTVIFAYGEGYRALVRRWVPGLFRRLRRLRQESSLFLRLLAPAYGLALITPDRGQRLRAWLGTGAIVAAIVLVSRLPEPWRGIVDLAVAAALLIGLVDILRRMPALFD